MIVLIGTQHLWFRGIDYGWVIGETLGRKGFRGDVEYSWTRCAAQRELVY